MSDMILVLRKDKIDRSRLNALAYFYEINEDFLFSKKGEVIEVWVLSLKPRFAGGIIDVPTPNDELE